MTAREAMGLDSEWMTSELCKYKAHTGGRCSVCGGWSDIQEPCDCGDCATGPLPDISVGQDAMLAFDLAVKAIPALQGRLKELEAERAEILSYAIAFAGHIAYRNPKFMHDGRLQDPLGVHGFIEKWRELPTPPEVTG